MSSSKKDFVLIGKVINDFINNLSESDYESLINGTSIIKLKKKELPEAARNIYSDILKELVNSDEDKLLFEIDSINEIKSKMDRIKFCDYLNIPLLKKDTNEDIKAKIASYIINNKDGILYRLNKKDNMTDSLGRIAETLERYMDENEAKEFLLACDLFSNKANSYKLASILDVYVPKDKSNEDIIDLIVSSVVGAKIRSYKIRNKELNS